LAEPQRVRDIIGRAALLSDHYLSIVSLMKMNARRSNDPVDKAG
jgi:hypothetical protein